MLPVSYRHVVFVDPRDSKIYSSNGSHLERFRVEDSYLVFEKSWKVLQNGTPITGIFEFVEGSKLVVFGEEELVLFNPESDKVEAKDVLSDRIIIAKPLDSGEICVVSGRKKLIFYKISASSFEMINEYSMGTKATIFSCDIVGRNLDDLVIYTGNVLGKIEVFNFSPSSPHLYPALIISKHDGMVFSICVHDDKIYSISDDRSIRAFNRISGEELTLCYGHETRPRSLTVSDDGKRIFTGGDSICIWKWNEKELLLAERREPAIGKIYSLKVVNDLLLASSVTGSLVALGIENKPFKKSILPELSDPIVRSFIKISKEEYFIVDTKKDLLYINESRREVVIKNQHLRSESLTTSESGKFLSVTNDWKIFIIEIETKRSCTIATENVLGGAVFAGDSLIAVSKTGQSLTIDISNGILSKKEWSMNLKHSILCAITFKSYFILGFSRGFLSIYTTDENPKEVFFTKISKRGDSVVDLCILDSRLLVLTRDGKCIIFNTDNFPNLTLSEITSTIPTPERFLFDKFSDNRYIWGFKSVDFVICKIDSPNPLISLECGGGNRPHALDPVYSGDKLIGFKFGFVKKGVLNVVEITLPFIQYVVGAYHKNSIFALAAVPTSSEKLKILTAGIDTEIQLHEVDESGRAKRKWISSSHLSSVNSLSILEKPDENCLLASGGGNSEIKIWKIEENLVNFFAEFRGTPDYRYISLKITTLENRIFIFAVCSIRQLHIFELVEEEKKVKKLIGWENLDYSTFVKVDYFFENNLFYICCAATSGYGYCNGWNPNEYEEFKDITQIRVSESGLSSVCCIKEIKTVATGSESGEICFTDFKSKNVLQRFEHTHFSTVSDMCYIEKNGDFILASISTDLVFSLMKIQKTNEGYSIQLLRKSITNIGDPMALIPIEKKGDYEFLVGGQGFEVL